MVISKKKKKPHYIYPSGITKRWYRFTTAKYIVTHSMTWNFSCKLSWFQKWHESSWGSLVCSSWYESRLNLYRDLVSSLNDSTSEWHPELVLISYTCARLLHKFDTNLKQWICREFDNKTTIPWAHSEIQVRNMKVKLIVIWNVDRKLSCKFGYAPLSSIFRLEFRV